MNVQHLIKSNCEEFEVSPMIHPSGFREYDARWLYPDQINLLGFQRVGAALAIQIWESGQNPPKIIVGHDYREYSQAIKNAVIVGLISAGAHIYDIGLAITPMAYFARKHLGIPSVAMITASHNENGWAGVKVGIEPPLTHGPKEMQRFKDLSFEGQFESRPGQYSLIKGLKADYMKDLLKHTTLKHKPKIVVSTGNGTAGIVAPELFRGLGCEVVELDCDLDWTFPNYNPNPESLKMLNALSEKVLQTNASIGFAFDGDGDRVGVVDENGEELFSDKLGLLLARNLSKEYPNSKFVVDVKSTGLFMDDETLKQNGCTVEYWITGHSYMKSRVWESQALAGFEKSGHFFFSEPLGYGYDDGLASAIQLCKVLDNQEINLASLRKSLPKTWQSPTISPFCADDEKYDVVANITGQYEKLYAENTQVAKQNICELITINGVRVCLEDGTWGLVRASSNKPCLVIVVESPVSEARMLDIYRDIVQRLDMTGKVSEYDQPLSI